MQVLHVGIATSTGLPRYLHRLLILSLGSRGGYLVLSFELGTLCLLIRIEAYVVVNDAARICRMLYRRKLLSTLIKERIHDVGCCCGGSTVGWLGGVLARDVVVDVLDSLYHVVVRSLMASCARTCHEWLVVRLSCQSAWNSHWIDHMVMSAHVEEVTTVLW